MPGACAGVLGIGAGVAGTDMAPGVAGATAGVAGVPEGPGGSVCTPRKASAADPAC